jgi:hypothetical protein
VQAGSSALRVECFGETRRSLGGGAQTRRHNVPTATARVKTTAPATVASMMSTGRAAVDAREQAQPNHKDGAFAHV